MDGTSQERIRKIGIKVDDNMKNIIKQQVTGMPGGVEPNLFQTDVHNGS